MRTRLYLLCILLLLLATTMSAQTIYNVKTGYGAKGDGSTNDTKAIQNAINACNSGGQVYIPAGTYKTTTLTLKSNMTLKIDAGALLQASLVQSDWTAAGSGPVLSGTSLNNISIIGSGTIDGGGLVYYVNGSTISGSIPQKIIVIGNCTNVTVTGIRLQNSTVQTFELTQCDTALVDGVIVRTRDRTYGSGTDGIDVSGRYLTIQNVDIETGDDAFCIKPQGDAWHSPARPSHDITLQNSILASTCHTLKFGTKTTDELYNVKFIHNTINKHSGSPGSGGNTDDMASGVCEVAISLEANDGSNIHDVLVDDIHITRCGIPIWLEIEQRSGSSFGKLNNITVSNIVCDNSEMTSNINVQSGARLSNITLSNLTIHNYETYTGTSSPLWLDGTYPYGIKVGSTINRMPAYGLFARCVDGLALTGTNNFYDDGHSGRPATKYEDVVLSNPTNYTLTTSSSGNGSISLSPSGGSYASGTVVTLTATPGSGSTFSSWSGDLSGSANPTTITMNSNKSVTATFAGGGGALITNLSCKDATNAADWSVQSNLQQGNTVYGDRTFTITSLPSAYAGLAWIRTANDSKGVSSDPLVTFTVTANCSVYVAYNDNISPKSSWITSGWTDTGNNIVISDGSQTLSVYKKYYAANASVSLGPNMAGGSGSIDTYIIMAQATTPPVNYTLTTTVTGTGSVAASPSGGTYASGTVVTVTANPGSGYKFSSWSGDLSGSTNPTTITMNANKSVTANFVIIPTYTLAVGTLSNGAIALSPTGGSYAEGTVVTVTASPNSGYQFSSWSGDLSGSTNPATITMNANKNIGATFTAIPAQLITTLSCKDATNAADWSIQSNLQQGNTVYGDRTFTITTLPSAYAGSAWIRTANDSKGASADPLVTFTVTANCSVYVAYNDNISPKSSWITSGWTDTGDNIVISDGSQALSVYKKYYAANASVSLGPNMAGGSGSIDTYIIIVIPSGLSTPSSQKISAEEAPNHSIGKIIAPTTEGMLQNYPNPFNPATTINYSLLQAGSVKLTIYDMLGREVMVLVNGFVEAGIHQAVFDAGKYSSGMYFYKLTTGNVTQVKRMLLIK